MHRTIFGLLFPLHVCISLHFDMDRDLEHAEVTLSYSHPLEILSQV